MHTTTDVGIRQRPVGATWRGVRVTAFLALAVARCSADSAANTVDAATARDTTVDAVGDATQDGSVNDATQDGSVNDATQDGSVNDATQDAVSIVGTWRDCVHTLRVATDGTYDQTDERFSCHTTGRWTVSGNRVDLVVSTTTCMSRPADLPGVVAVVTAGTLTFFHPLLTPRGEERYYDDATPHVRWRLTGNRVEPGMPAGAPRVSVVRIVGDATTGAFNGCYWSADGMCNGIFSCSGTVSQWLTGGGMLNAGLSCIGTCTCGSSLAGTLTGTHVDGTFLEATCQNNWQGSFTGDIEADD